jgi:ribonuclease HI
VKNGITCWIKNWKLSNWKKYDKTPVLNKDLWSALDELNSELDPNWSWIRGHFANKWNIVVDNLANKEANNLIGK